MWYCRMGGIHESARALERVVASAALCGSLAAGGAIASRASISRVWSRVWLPVAPVVVE